MVNDALARFSDAGESSRERVSELWDKDKEARRPQEKQWQINAAFYLGQQWVGWDAGRLAVDELKAPSWKIQAVDNKIYVKCRSKQTRMMADMQPQALPETSDATDIRRAKYKERVLNHIRRECNEREKRFHAAQWVSVTGDGYLEAYWDEDAGDTFCDDSGLISLGEVGIRVRGPFEVWPGASCSNGNNGGRLWVADIMPVDLAKLKYNTENISADASELDDMKLRSRMEGYFSGHQATGGDMRRLDDQVMVKTLYEFKSRKNPSGTISIVINGRVIEERPLDWFGITHLVNAPNFNSYYGDTEVRQAIQRQKSYNRLLSSAEEYLRTMKGKWLIHSSNKIKSHQVDTEHGEKLIYDGSGPAPQAITPPPLPSDVWNLMNITSEAIDDIFSDHAASQGKAPASASGSAINYLVEEDSRAHTPTRLLWEQGWERHYEKCLDVAAKHYTADRTILILGEDRRADVEGVNMELLAGRNRIKIVVGTSLPENKTLRSEVVRRNFSDGLYGDPAKEETRLKVLRLLDVGLVDDIYDDTYLDEMRQQKEIDQLKLGITVPVRPEENHNVHARVITRYMKSSEFLALPRPIQDKFDDHREVHMNNGVDPNVIAAMQKMAQDKAQGKGLGPGNSPAVANPVDMLRSAGQGGEPSPAPGV
jgi:hypothetical protein